MRKCVKIAIVLCLLLALCLTGCKKGEKTSEKQTAATTAVEETAVYEVKISTRAGIVLEGVQVYLYADAEGTDMLDVQTTDNLGYVSFIVTKAEGMSVKLKNVPTGYDFSEDTCYPILGELTEIVLAPKTIGDEPIDPFQLSDVMPDFRVTDADGKEHTFSELTAGKDAVVLLFWSPEEELSAEEMLLWQEALSETDKAAVLALAPETDVATIKAFGAAKKLDLPLVRCGQNIADAFGVTTYPTFAVVDREGKIAMIYATPLEEQEIVSGILEYFTADEYAHKPVTELTDILPEGEVGSVLNPHQISGDTKVEITIEAGKEYHAVVFARAAKLYMSCRSKDLSFEYNGKVYEPQNGLVGTYVSSPDPFTPAKVVFKNNSTEKQTFTVTFGMMPGTFDNPYSFELGELEVNVPAGANEGKGVHYAWFAKEDGYLSVEVLEGTSECGFTLYNLNSYQYLVSESDLLEDAEKPTLRIKAKKGQEIMLIVSTIPAADFTYPAGSFKFEASFKEGLDPEDLLEDKKVDYTLTVKDDKGQVMEGVQLQITGVWKDDEDVEQTVNESVKTDENGVATIKLMPSTYTVSLRLPEGYKSEVTRLELTTEVLTGEFTLSEVVIVMKNYTVTVEDTAAMPVAGALVSFGGKAGTTDANGKVMFELEEDTYTVFISVPAGYTCDMPSQTFAEGETELVFTVLAPAGTVGNPIQLSLAAVPGSFETEKIPAGETVYYDIFGANQTMMTVENADVEILYGGRTYAPENGVISMFVESMNPRMPVNVGIVNKGTGEAQFELKFNALLGSYGNPQELTDISEFTADLDPEDYDGYCYYWIATGTGTVYFYLDEYDTKTEPNICLSSDGSDEYPWWSDGDIDDDLNQCVKLDVSQGDKVLIQVHMTMDEETFLIPGGYVTVTGRFEGKEEEPVEPEKPDVPAGTYMVTVEDYFGNPMTGAVVSLVTNGTMVAMQQVNDQGVMSVALIDGEYTVSLSFTDGVVRHYQPVTLTPDKAAVTVRVAENVSDETGSIYGNPTHFVKVGGTYVTLQSDIVTYFMFAPEEEGIYKFTTSDPTAVISYWGGNVHFIWDQTATTDYADNAFTREVKTENLGVVHIIGVTGADEAIIEVTRIGGPTYDPVRESAWVPYELSWLPTSFTLPAGTTLTNVDVTGSSDYYKIVMNENDGFYHVGSADGPVLYMNLGADAPYVSMYNLLGMSGFGGTRFGYYFFDENGEFLYKESYNDGMIMYVQKASSGVYPVTPDLAYMMQMGGAEKGWWDENNPNYLFGDLSAPINTEIAWMFCCCFDVSQYDYTEPAPTTKTYTVSVTDYYGEPIKSAVVSIFADGAMVTMQPVNDSGVVAVELPITTYTVSLSFTDGVTRHYTAGSLTPENSNLTVKVAQDVSSRTENLYDEPTHFVDIGGTYVTLQADVDNYFFFEPTGEGVFKFTTSDPAAVISYWGSNPHFIWDQTTNTDYADNAFTIEVRADNLGANYIIGVTGASEAIIEITLIGGPSFDPERDAVWEEYVPKVAAKSFRLPSGTRLTQVDLTATADQYNLVLDDQGIYHVGSETGPVVYIKLGQGAPYVSMYDMLGMSGFGGTRFGKKFYDGDGNFLRKESYNEAMLAFTGAIDPNTGVYPLTEDLAYMMKMGGEGKGWWNPDDGNFLFKDADGNVDTSVNLEIAWLFACYVAN